MIKKITKFFVMTVIVLVVIALSYFFWWTSKHDYPVKIIFINDSNISVSSAEIKYCNQTINLFDIKPSESISRDSKRGGDCSFNIKIIFSDDNVIENNNLGYITSGLDIENIFQITEHRELNFSQK